ncbi:MAG: membrane-bound lytic murein transglycosylase MltF [Magnetococcales bacterium]|nr:membrane-bound lytic murein transglycosylase MltF [Magnetococcales bacterium]MBF0156372.1 membrane-bound lytic murein transglycosylase MltF [Magnetococcales bacterium]
MNRSKVPRSANDAHSGRVRAGRLAVGIVAVAVAVSLPLVGCNLRLERPEVEEIRQKGVLTVVTRSAPTTYYEGRDQQGEGFEHDLVVAFAQHLGVVPSFLVLHNTADILQALRDGRGDLAAAGLVVTPELRQEFRLGPVYQEVDQQLVCRRGGRRPRNLLQMAKVTLAVEEGGGYDDRLRELKELVPGLKWKTDPESSTEQMLEKVWRKEIDCTVADSNIVALNRRYYPELVVKFPVGSSRSLAWVLPKRGILLERELRTWFASVAEGGWLADLEERYYGHVGASHNEYDYVDTRRFLARMEDRLPRYREIFERAGRRYRTSWQLLAALSYQESHWDPEATSHTGVKGIMMLTRATARGLGVGQRTDPEESILGGAWYLARLRRELPPGIAEPDRTWIALAAYNAGPGHILDARTLARKFGKNPDMWKDLREVLPLLSLKKYFTLLKHGYARGQETAHYVQKIRHYYDLLMQGDAILARDGTMPKLALPLVVSRELGVVGSGVREPGVEAGVAASRSVPPGGGREAVVGAEGVVPRPGVAPLVRIRGKVLPKATAVAALQRGKAKSAVASGIQMADRQQSLEKSRNSGRAGALRRPQPPAKARVVGKKPRLSVKSPLTGKSQVSQKARGPRRSSVSG